MALADYDVKEKSRHSWGDTDRVSGWVRWLDRPLSASWCAFGWFAATAVFIGMVRFVGGPVEGDSAESLYSTVAIAHGRLSCAFGPITKFHVPNIARPGPFVAPLWPLLSGAFASLARIGHDVPFPSQAEMGTNCSTALPTMYRWIVHANAAEPVVRLGYLASLILMAGVVALLRATGRGRRVWEPFALLVVACIPSIWMALSQYFHPQDIVAIGLALGGVACVRRGSWAWAGVLLGLAITSQQFALLVLAPLVVLAPAHRRARFVGGASAAAALVIVPVLVATSGRAFGSAVIGSGNSHSFGGTILRELHLHGALLLASSRVAPIAISMALAWWALQRLGPSALDPVSLVSLVATSLSLRLVFEQNLFGYYFLALALSIVLLDVVRGKLRGTLVAWLALLTLAYSPVSWGFVSNSVTWGLQEREFLPFVGMLVALLILIHDARRGRVRRYVAGWLAVVVLGFARLPWTNPPLRDALPTWFWQTVLVGTGVGLAVGPLLAAVRDRETSRPDQDVEQKLIASW